MSDPQNIQCPIRLKLRHHLLGHGHKIRRSGLPLFVLQPHMYPSPNRKLLIFILLLSRITVIIPFQIHTGCFGQPLLEGPRHLFFQFPLSFLFLLSFQLLHPLLLFPFLNHLLLFFNRIKINLKPSGLFKLLLVHSVLLFKIQIFLLGNGKLIDYIFVYWEPKDFLGWGFIF